jgi:hypothetical protein
MTPQPDLTLIINELSSQIAAYAREVAILKSVVAQYEREAGEKVATPEQ